MFRVCCAFLTKHLLTVSNIKTMQWLVVALQTIGYELDTSFYDNIWWQSLLNNEQNMNNAFCIKIFHSLLPYSNSNIQSYVFTHTAPYINACPSGLLSWLYPPVSLHSASIFSIYLSFNSVRNLDFLSLLKTYIYIQREKIYNFISVRFPQGRNSTDNVLFYSFH